MACGCRGAAAGQNEFLERRQVLIEPIQHRLEPIDMRRLDHDMSGNAQLPAQIEEIVLNLSQGAPDLRWQYGIPENNAQGRIGLVARTIGLNAQALVGAAPAG